MTEQKKVEREDMIVGALEFCAQELRDLQVV